MQLAISTTSAAPQGRAISSLSVTCAPSTNRVSLVGLGFKVEGNAKGKPRACFSLRPPGHARKAAILGPSTGVPKLEGSVEHSLAPSQPPFLQAQADRATLGMPSPRAMEKRLKCLRCGV